MEDIIDKDNVALICCDFFFVPSCKNVCPPYVAKCCTNILSLPYQCLLSKLGSLPLPLQWTLNLDITAPSHSKPLYHTVSVLVQ